MRHAYKPIRRRQRQLYAKDYTPKPYEHKYEVHHIKFRRHGGSNEDHNLIALTPEQHHALHDIADKPLRSANGRKVMNRKGYAAHLARRQNEIHRAQVGNAKYREHFRQLAIKRWRKAKINGVKEKRLIKA